ncbi:M66 family metalloprotease [Shewanella fidelis]|uniref:M66 family metalloprotease n=1 Tax=Shewanella fidelis TaxID=173509 RepID=A0AAW8NGK6_9GAMM|nr:M66 family metalloprotease [Shewanella fidelis]MDR8522488.1 M66 family metalloprotease [Shewanella fidelis]MDW4812978.1 M66 family metalloprotease [Shewanella fidelis]MDW4816763.1 M66 family metalloprotease [Shewanella fidelis]MDW4820985.1 M66 family metalloprotease [Shewanella fidelis]MDW4825480.1 M66 family metalloprotease [Shewanella fidelis]
MLSKLPTSPTSKPLTISLSHACFKNTYLATIIATLLTSAASYSTTVTAEELPSASSLLVFNNNDFPSDLEGSLAASVSFAQSQIIPSKHGAEGDIQPHLTAQRASLLMVKPKQTDLNTAIPMHVTATDKQGRNLGTMKLDPPAKLPTTVYAIGDVLPSEVDFTPMPGSSAVLNTSTTINQLNDPNAALLFTTLESNELVEINTADYIWTKNIYLPNSDALSGKVVKISSKAGYASTIHYGERTASISRHQSLTFKCINGQWFQESDLINNTLTYADNTWSLKVPANWIQPGFKMQFSHGELSGELTDVKVGAPSELLLHTIDIGMLTAPRGEFDFATDPTAQREYFQTLPVSRMTVSQYETVYLAEVMLPDGTLLTDFDPSTGDWHSGTMRQRIGKELISIGINNANYGINSSAGIGVDAHPYSVSQLTAHNNRGNYQNGIVTHGGSGGGGIVTLDSSLGNEFSHEVGHNFGIGHYPGGFNGSIHRPADAINSTWGWDSDLNKFIPNMYSKITDGSACRNGECQSPFEGRKYGSDAMAGGKPMSSANRFTLYTPYTAAHIQQNLETKAVFSSNSATGFKLWDAKTHTMKPYQHRVIDGEQINASISELSEQYLSELVNQYDQVTIAMSNGNWAKYIDIPKASISNIGKTISFNHKAGYDSHLNINDDSFIIATGFNTSYTSDGITWNESNAPDLTIAKVPTAFGVPVTTLVGYYDPEGILPSYIYPALHGSYGFTYNDDSGHISQNSCQLQVETSSGQRLAYKLANSRRNDTVMNKFHINIAEDAVPQSATVRCNSNSLASRQIEPTKSPLSYTVNGDGNTYYKWGDNERYGNIGDLFIFDNPKTGDKELFMLTGLGDDLRYWYFPSNKGNNKFWTYISDIE